MQQFVADRYFGSCGAAFGNTISLKLSARPQRDPIEISSAFQMIATSTSLS
jgi:hypothetical protein